MNVKRFGLMFLAIVLLITGSVVLAQGNRTLVRLHQVGHSGVEGFVLLRQLPNEGGTRINVVGFGLKPGNAYVSLYYSNHVCELEPYEAADLIGGIYTANRVGVGVTQGDADDNLDEINSVSVRRASDFQLLACANVHP